MSVPKGHQGDGKLLVNELARDLAVYTIRITSNPKVFLPQYQTALTNEIVRCATNIHKYAWTANNVMVRGPDGREKYALRRKHQELAAAECNNLISLILRQREEGAETAGTAFSAGGGRENPDGVCGPALSVLEKPRLQGQHLSVTVPYGQLLL